MIAVGDRVPPNIFRELGPVGPETVSSDTLFAGRRVVLFSCPGAFTPKSSEQHVPSYLACANEILAEGIDEILCVSVNDSFVMAAWANYLGVGKKLRMLADGQCEFHTSIGLHMDCTRFSLGFRNHRFSMIINDSIVEELFLESPGAYEVSDASVVLRQLRSKK